MGPDSVRRLEIWHEAIAVVKSVYGLTRTWPRDELYNLTSQVRRAAISVPSNIAEGVGRGTAAEAAHFAQIALGSAYELDTLLHIAIELGLSASQPVVEIRARLNSLARRLSKFVRYKRSLKPPAGFHPRSTFHDPRSARIRL